MENPHNRTRSTRPGNKYSFRTAHIIPVRVSRPRSPKPLCRPRSLVWPTSEIPFACRESERTHVAGNPFGILTLHETANGPALSGATTGARDTATDCRLPHLHNFLFSNPQRRRGGTI